MSASERKSDLDVRKALEDLSAEGVQFVQIETPDINGTLRGKLTRVDKALSESGSAFCTIIYGMSRVDDISEGPLSSFDNGFPDAFAVADPSTVRLIDPARKVAAVICDMYDAERNDHYPHSPRGVLHQVVDRSRALGYEARFAVELELCVLHADDPLIRAERHYDQTAALGRTHNAYSLIRMSDLREIAVDFMAEMDRIDIPLDAIHTELGGGMLEVAISHLPALQAADACARVKLYMKEFLAKRGLAAVFMPKWRHEESGCGGHVHQSLWKDGEPAFATKDGNISETARQYIAGQLASLNDFAAIFYPTINAYRRMDASTWAPENVSWGVDNRTCALRMIARPGPKAYRIEHRCPGADINSYLAIAAMLAGGIHGIEERLDPPVAIEGNAADMDLNSLPTTLSEATERLAHSRLARDLLGHDLIEQFVIMQRNECSRWHSWQRNQVSPWEVTRYFDAL